MPLFSPPTLRLECCIAMIFGPGMDGRRTVVLSLKGECRFALVRQSRRE
jgi:hypothetical protein